MLVCNLAGILGIFSYFHFLTGILPIVLKCRVFIKERINDMKCNISHTLSLSHTVFFGKQNNLHNEIEFI